MPITEWVSPLATSGTIVTTTELAVVTIASVSTDGPSRTIELLGEVELGVGTGTTLVTFRIRRGTGITGAVVGTSTTDQPLVGAGAWAQYVFEATDTPGEVAGLAYTLTVQQTAATANGSINRALLTARMV